jgi:hypothetical protein
MSEIFHYDGEEYTLPSPHGLTFESLPVNLQVIVRGETPIWDHGIQIGKEKELTAEFGDTNAPMIYDESTGDTYVQLRGGSMNTLEQGRAKNWTDDERVLVEKKLLVTQTPQTHWLRPQAVVLAPWPTYDETDEGMVATLALTLGLVHEALVYEDSTLKRKKVLSELSKAAEQLDAEVDLETVEAL